MAVFMFALTGIPPLAGFFGKLYVFKAAVDAGLAWLAIVGVINSAIGAYYYLRVTVSMYMADPVPLAIEAPKPQRPVWAAIVLAAAGHARAGPVAVAVDADDQAGGGDARDAVSVSRLCEKSLDQQALFAGCFAWTARGIAHLRTGRGTRPTSARI